MEGWIKLHRKLRENPIYSNSVAVHVWVECLLRASHSDNALFLHRQKQPLKAGQFVMGRDEFGKSINASGSTAWFWLQQFKVDSMVDIKSSNKGSIITILKWRDYQIPDSKPDSQRTTDEQQMNTNKNDNNVKNDKNSTLRPVVAENTEGIVKMIDIFKQMNPLINFGNKTFRKSASELIDEFGEGVALKVAEYSVAVQLKDKFAPRISDPYQLKNKLGALKAYKQRESNSETKGIRI